MTAPTCTCLHVPEVDAGVVLHESYCPKSAPAPLSEQQLAESRQRAAVRVASLTGWLNAHSPFPGMDAVQDAEAVLEVDVPALLAEIDRLRAERHTTNEALSKRDVELEKKDRRLAELDARLNAVGAARTWRMENGKKFIYVEDIASAVLNTEAGDPR